MTTAYRLGVDIGGTFTDFAVVDEGAGTLRVEKMLTSAKAPEETVLRGIESLAEAIPDMLAQTSEVIHATTPITNVILERKGAKTGLLTTAGFRDILELAREVRYDIFDMFIRLRDRIVSLREANEYSVHTDKHLISNVRIKGPADGGGYAIEASYAMFQADNEGNGSLYSFGTYLDEVVFDGAAAMFRRKTVIVDNWSIPHMLSTPI